MFYIGQDRFISSIDGLSNLTKMFHHRLPITLLISTPIGVDPFGGSSHLRNMYHGPTRASYSPFDLLPLREGRVGRFVVRVFSSAHCSFLVEFTENKRVIGKRTNFYRECVSMRLARSIVVMDPRTRRFYLRCVVIIFTCNPIIPRTIGLIRCGVSADCTLMRSYGRMFGLVINKYCDQALRRLPDIRINSS